MNPDLSKLVPLDPGGTFEPLPENAIMKHYKGSASLNNMKPAAALFSGDEKRGVHAIAIGNANVIDVEVAINAKELGTKRDTPRIDLAAFTQKNHSVELVFWEAKLFTNKEIRSKANVPRVVDQIEEYRTVVKEYREVILEGYRTVASNMVSIAEMSGGKRTVGAAIQAVESGTPLVMDTPPKVGLIVYGFDADHKKSDIWISHLKTLREKIGSDLVRDLGKAKDVKL